MAGLSLTSRWPLRDGRSMPVLGLGTYLNDPGPSTREAVLSALREGYRLIDTAQGYRNEADVGAALASSGVPREEVFLTTKLANRNQGRELAFTSFQESLEHLATPYVDLFLLHWPVPKLRQESWKVLAQLKKEGLARSIGVSNYTVRHLQELMDHSGEVPVVDQVEFHPFLFQKELLEFCRKHRIQLEAYSPLVRGEKLTDPRLVNVAQAHGRSVPQVLLRWALQHEVVVIPKSTRLERIRENRNVFDFSLSPAEMALLDGCHENLHTCWDPTDAP